jgi:long-chain acyl-CoA synthetase
MSGPVADPADRLIEVLRSVGVSKAEILPEDRLAEDLHLDSLAMVQLQSVLEIEDAEWAEIRTVADLRAQRKGYQPGVVGVVAAREEASFPRWPWWSAVRRLRIAFLELVARPGIGLVLAPRIAKRVELGPPSLLIANHLTAFDVPVILYALSRKDRDRVAVAMSGRLLGGWKQGKAERHGMVAWLTPLAYWLLTALFNVFPLPRGAGLRRSFAHAGEAMDRGYHVLVFPEGTRSKDGQLQSFEPGIGILAQESKSAVQPIRIVGLRRGARRGEVSVRFGAPLRMEPGEEPLEFARRLEKAVAEL